MSPSHPIPSCNPGCSTTRSHACKRWAPFRFDTRERQDFIPLSGASSSQITIGSNLHHHFRIMSYVQELCLKVFRAPVEETCGVDVLHLSTKSRSVGSSSKVQGIYIYIEDIFFFYGDETSIYQPSTHLNSKSCTCPGFFFLVIGRQQYLGAFVRFL